MSLLQPYQPKGFLAGKERALAKKSKAEADALAKENATLDISKKRAEFEEYMNTAQERAEERQMALAEKKVKIKELRDKIKFEQEDQDMEAEMHEVEKDYKESLILRNKAEAGKLGSEGDYFSTQAEQGKSTTNKHQQASTKGFLNVRQLEKTLAMLEANPDDFGAAANLKVNLHGFATQLGHLLPDNPITGAVLDSLGEAFRVGDIATIKSNIALASSSLVQLVSGGDTRFTDFDMRRANEINIAAQNLTSGEAAIPVLRDIVRIVRNSNVMTSVLANHPNFADANAALEGGMFDYAEDGSIYTAPKIAGKVVPIQHLSDSPEDREIATSFKPGTKFTVTLRDGSRKHYTVPTKKK